MQHVSKLTTVRPLASPGHAPPANDAPQSTNTMGRLWVRMVKIYGHRWTSSFGESDDGTWAHGLRGLTAEQIALGLSRCVERGEAWPPTLPEFRALCTPTPADLGLPTVERAYRDAVFHTAGQPWLHPAVAVAAREVGVFDLQRLPGDKARALFERAYEIVCRRARAGEVLDAPIQKAIPVVEKPANPAVGAAAISAIRSMLGSSGCPAPARSVDEGSGLGSGRDGR